MNICLDCGCDSILMLFVLFSELRMVSVVGKPRYASVVGKPGCVFCFFPVLRLETAVGKPGCASVEGADGDTRLDAAGRARGKTGGGLLGLWGETGGDLLWGCGF